MTVLQSEEMAKGARLKIAYLLPQFPVPTQTFATSDIAALQADGHDVRVYTMKPQGSTSDEVSVPVSRLTLRGALSWPLAVWRMGGPVLALMSEIVPHFLQTPRTAMTALLCLPRATEIAADIEREGLDVVHLFWARHSGLVLALLNARGSPEVRSAFAGAYDLVADDFLTLLSLRSANIAFSHSEANRTFVGERVESGTPVEIIHRGIPLHKPDPKAERDAKQWITASALVKEKNVEGVLRAFFAARADALELRLSICGDGPDRARLEQWCSAQGCAGAVTFEGHIAREDLALRMARADVFVMLSKKPSERLPNVIKEALWAGCRVISSNSIGIREVLPDDSFGYVVDPDDERAVRAAVCAVVTRDRENDSDGQAKARALIEEKFSAAANMRRYVAAWTEAPGR
jgi:glycosyltransferase involved in cell wall biosynthesis